MVSEGHLPVYPAADSLHPAPSGLQVAEQFHRDIGQSVHLAVAAVQQIAERLRRQVIHRMLLRVGIRSVWGSRVLDHSGTTQPQWSRRRQPSGTAVAVAIQVALHLYLWTDAHFVRLTQILRTRGMHVQHSNHGHSRGNVELNVVSQTYQHARGLPLPGERAQPVAQALLPIPAGKQDAKSESAATATAGYSLCARVRGPHFFAFFAKSGAFRRGGQPSPSSLAPTPNSNKAKALCLNTYKYMSTIMGNNILDTQRGVWYGGAHG